METGSGNSGTTLKKPKFNRRKNDIYLGDKERGIRKGEEKMRKKEKKRKRIWTFTAGKKEK
jgi:hypothetical protein